MSRNAYALFEKKLIWNGGGHEMIIPNGGVYPSAAENGGGTHARPKVAQKRAPPSACFWHLP